jgi:hypothetical protein
MQPNQTILMPATPPAGHRVRLAMRAALGVAVFALPPAIALLLLAVLLT